MQCTQSQNSNAKLAKEPGLFLGIGNPLSVIQKHIIEDNEERENEYQEFAKLGSDGSRFSTLYFSIWFHIQQDVINLTCAYHQLLFLNLASVSWVDKILFFPL